MYIPLCTALSELIHQFLIPFVLQLQLRALGSGMQGFESVQPLLFVLPLFHRVVHFLSPLRQLLAVLGDRLFQRADKLLVVLPVGRFHTAAQLIIQLLTVLILIVEQHGKLLFSGLLSFAHLAQLASRLFYCILRQIAQGNQGDCGFIGFAPSVTLNDQLL